MADPLFPTSGRLLPTFFGRAGTPAPAVTNDWTRMMLGDGSWTITDPNSVGSESGYAFSESAAATSLTIDLSQAADTQTAGSARNGRRWMRYVTNPVTGASFKWSECWTLQMMIIIESRPTLTDDIYLLVGVAEGKIGTYRTMQGGLLFDGGAGPELKVNKSGDANGYAYGSPNNNNEMAYVVFPHHPYQYARGVVVSTGLADASQHQSTQFVSVADEFSGSGAVVEVGVGFWVGCHTAGGTGTGTVTFRAYYKFDAPDSGYEPTS